MYWKYFQSRPRHPHRCPKIQILLRFLDESSVAQTSGGYPNLLLKLEEAGARLLRIVGADFEVVEVACKFHRLDTKPKVDLVVH
jgi:hypothetical protein